MIIQCKSCSRKFVVDDKDIPEKGRTVQCGYCSVTWHQMPIRTSVTTIRQTKIDKPIEKISESLSVEKIKASDGKTYRFLGSQWAELLPSGKTGLFARKKIGQELDKLTGRKINIIQKKTKKTKRDLDPSLESVEIKKQTRSDDKSKKGLGFFGYIFLIIIIGFSIVGIMKTFQNDLLNYFPEAEYIFEQLDLQLEYLAETVKNIIILAKDLINSY